MNKKCINCGKSLPESAAFCPYCTTIQSEKDPVRIPRLWRKKMLAGLVVLLVIATAFGINAYRHRPKVYEAEGQLTYSDRDGTYDVILSFFGPEEGHRVDCIKDRVISIKAGEMWCSFTHLFAYSANGSAELSSEFMDKVERLDLSVESLDGKEPFTLFMPREMPEMPFALRSTQFAFTTNCGQNRLTWHLYMKNGDVIHLSHRATVVEEVEQ